MFVWERSRYLVEHSVEEKSSNVTAGKIEYLWKLLWLVDNKMLK